MTNYQILLVINVLLLGVAILSMHFLALKRKQARQAQIDLEDARKELGEARKEGDGHREKARQAQIDMESIRKKLENAEDQVEHYREQVRFTQEAYEDCQKETNDALRKVKDHREQIKEERNREKVEFAKKIFPIQDKIKRDLDDLHIDDESSVVTRIIDNMKLCLEEIDQAMERSGFQVVDPRGKFVDRKIHRVVDKEVREGIDPGVVVSVYRRGWLFDGTTVRFADVVVTK